MNKKTLLVLVSMLALLLAGGIGTGYAKVSGPCGDCHTMHNSQGGSYEAVDDDGNESTTPYAHLTKSSCLGCHSTHNEIGPAVNMSYTDVAGFGSTPVAAGGSFAVWGGSNAAEDAKVHNVVGIVGLDIIADTVNTSANNGVPGLGSENMNLLVSGSDDPAVLTCAGAYGCHGEVTDAGLTTSDTGIRGFHHGSTAYRYLNIATTGLNVSGDGDPDWEQLGTSTSRNIYSASTTVGINKLCANCHPDFHGNPNKGTASNTSDGSSWIRHPTDNLLSVLSNVQEDYDNNPFAFVDISILSPADEYTAASTGAAVACISCHRAHGSPYADILRWDYDTQNAGEGINQNKGCLGCHYDQR